MATVRYMVGDVAAAVEFYMSMFGFELIQRFGPTIAIVERGDLRLWLAGPSSSAARAMPDGRIPEPGGWNRFVIETEDLDGLIERLRGAGATFRNEVVTGPGGRQILVEDPSRNPIELFEPA